MFRVFLKILAHSSNYKALNVCCTIRTREHYFKKCNFYCISNVFKGMLSFGQFRYLLGISIIGLASGRAICKLSIYQLSLATIIP